MLKKTLSIICIGCSLFTNLSVAGQENEIGIWGGVAQGFGDINSSINSFQFYHSAGGVFYKYNFNPRLGWYIGGAAGSTEGYDYISEDVFQQTRNLDFKTSVTEINTRIDFNFFSFDRTKPRQWFTPYVFIGVNGFYFNPKGLYQGNWVELQPLGTEGQNVSSIPDKKPYQRLQIGIPLGGGFKFALSENWAIGLEVNWHKLFTDYFDDVSTRYVDPALLATGSNGDMAVQLADKSNLLLDIPALGEPGRKRGDIQFNDAYMYGGIVISYTIVNLKCPPPSAKGFKKK